MPAQARAEVRRRVRPTNPGGEPHRRVRLHPRADSAARNHEIRASSEVRRWLARELHDGPVQTLPAMVVELETLRRVPQLDEVTSVRVDRLAEAARTVMQEMRTLLYDMRDEPLMDLDVSSGVRELVGHFRSVSGMNVDLSVPSTPLALTSPRSVELRRIVAEALCNAQRHSQASRVDVQLRVSGGTLTVTVADNGRGFHREISPAGTGQRGMFERAAVIGALLTIDGGSATGTTVRIAVPISEAA